MAMTCVAWALLALLALLAIGAQAVRCIQTQHNVLQLVHMEPHAGGRTRVDALAMLIVPEPAIARSLA